MPMRACYDLGHLQQARGLLSAALATYRRGLAVVSPPGQPRLPAAGLAEVGMAEVLYERDELGHSLEHATAGVNLCRRLAFAPPLASGLVTLARIRQAQGDSAGALEAIGEAERILPGPRAVDLLNPVPALRARLALATGEVAEAASWVKAHGLAPGDQPSYAQERAYLVLVRVLLAGRAPDRALRLLERLHDLAVSQGRVGSVIETQALQALALSGAGDEAAALGTLAETLALGAPEGYLRVFVDEGPPMAVLFRNLLGRREQVAAAGAVPGEYLPRLVAAFQQAGAPIFAPARRGGVVVPGLVER